MTVMSGSNSPNNDELKLSETGLEAVLASPKFKDVQMFDNKKSAAKEKEPGSLKLSKKQTST